MRWAVNTETGKLMPFDSEPNPQGRWRLAANRAGRPPRALYVAEEDRARLLDELMVPHWATCPYAEQHRRSR